MISLQINGGPEFFPGFLRNCINCVHNCEDHSSFEGLNVILKGVFHQIYNVVNVVSVCINLFLNYQCPLPNYIFEIYEHSKISHRLILMVLDVTKYLNGKLKEKTEYVVFQRSFDKDGNYENEGFIQFATKSKLCWLVCLL